MKEKENKKKQGKRPPRLSVVTESQKESRNG